MTGQKTEEDEMRRPEPAGVATRQVMWTGVALAILPVACIAVIAVIFELTGLPYAATLERPAAATAPWLDKKTYRMPDGMGDHESRRPWLEDAMRAITKRKDPYAPVFGATDEDGDKPP